MTVPQPARLKVDNLPTVFPNAAGLDIGSAEIVAALPLRWTHLSRHILGPRSLRSSSPY